MGDEVPMPTLPPMIESLAVPLVLVPIPTLSDRFCSLTIDPSSAHPAAADTLPQDNVPDPLVVRTVEDDPSEEG